MWILKQIVKKSEYCSGAIRKVWIRNKVPRFAKYDDEEDNYDYGDYYYYYYYNNDGGGGENIDITLIMVSIIM